MKAKRTRVVVKPSLLSDISRMIEEARSAVAVTVNAGLTILYWQIGKRINEEILKGDGRNTEKRLSLRCRDNWSKRTEGDSPKRMSGEWCSSRTPSRIPQLSRRCRDN